MPEASITLVGLPWAKTFVERFARYLDSFQEFPGFEGLPERAFDPARMQAFISRGRSFDLAIQLHGNGSVTNRFLRRLRPLLTAGFFRAGHPCPDPARFIEYPEGVHEIRRLLRLLQHLGIPSAGEDLEFPLAHADFHEANQLAAGLQPGDFVCLHPGARDPKRRWPLENFVEVGKALAARGLRVVLTGTNDEADQTAILHQQLGDSCLDLAGKTNLGGLGALLKKARLLISNDTGISHLAVALRVPSVVIFSGSDPRRWAPLDTSQHRAVGDPFAPSPVQAAPGAVLREASNLLSESPLRVEARYGGFPVLPELNWSRVKRLLLVYEGSAADTIQLAPSIAALRSRWSVLALLASEAGGAVASLFPGIDRMIVAEAGSLAGPIVERAVRTLVDNLRAGSFDASIIFTKPGQSPYRAAYACYLAGIPVRVGASKEFGGALLSHWVRKLPELSDLEERYLALLRAVGLPSSPEDPALCIPADVEARVNGSKTNTGSSLILLDECEEDAFAHRLRNLTGMRVIRESPSSRASLVEFAALVRAADLVITANPVTGRIADAFGRPLIAVGEAASSSDGWRPRRSLAKLVAGANANTEDLVQAVTTLLWLPASRLRECDPTDSSDLTDPSDAMRPASSADWR